MYDGCLLSDITLKYRLIVNYYKRLRLVGVLLLSV